MYEFIGIVFDILKFLLIESYLIEIKIDDFGIINIFRSKVPT